MLLSKKNNLCLKKKKKNDSLQLLIIGVFIIINRIAVIALIKAFYVLIQIMLIKIRKFILKSLFC